MRLRLLFLFLLASIIANSQYINRDGYTIWTGRMWVGSGTSVTAPPSNVWLQLGDSATTKALWLPRVQNLTDIPTPKQGMIVYNISDSTVYYRRLFSWTAIGSGGSGIAQLGTSPFGLIRLNDSTYLVDSMKLITKYQSEKSRDSLGALIATKQATLVSGTNIKTINGNSLLGSGDLVISGGSSDSSTLIVDTTFTRLAAVISTDTLKLKSIRIQVNGSTLTPTETDSTASWDISASSGGYPEVPAVNDPNRWIVVQDANNPIFSRYNMGQSSPGVWKESSMYAPSPVSINDTLFRVYAKGDATNSIHYWESRDSMRTWAYVDTAIYPTPSPTWDSVDIAFPFVAYDNVNDTIHLYYTGGKGLGGPDYGIGHIAFKSNASHPLTRPSTPMLSHTQASTLLGVTVGFIDFSSMIKKDGKHYWFGSYSANDSVYLFAARGNDWRNIDSMWKIQGPHIANNYNGVINPTVWRDGTTYYSIFSDSRVDADGVRDTSKSMLASMYSTNLYNWTRLPGYFMQPRGDTSWNGKQVYDMQFLKVNGGNYDSLYRLPKDTLWGGPAKDQTDNYYYGFVSGSYFGCCLDQSGIIYVLPQVDDKMNFGITKHSYRNDISFYDRNNTLMLNIPDASAIARGALTAEDWRRFRYKADSSGQWSYIQNRSTIQNDANFFIGGYGASKKYTIGGGYPTSGTYSLEVDGYKNSGNVMSLQNASNYGIKKITNITSEVAELWTGTGQGYLQMQTQADGINFNAYKYRFKPVSYPFTPMLTMFGKSDNDTTIEMSSVRGTDYPHTDAGITLSVLQVDGYNTTSGALNSYGIESKNTATRTSGSNALTNYGGRFSASGGQNNYSLSLGNPAQYEANYGSSFTDRSLVDKKYVDSVSALGGGSSITIDSMTYNNSESKITLNITGQSDVSVTLPNSYLLNALNADSISKQVNDSTVKLKSVTVSANDPYLSISTTRTDTTINHAIVRTYVSEPIISFTAGAGFAADTTVFTDSTLYGSFYTGQDSFYVTKAFAVLKGQSGDTLGIQVVYNDTFNVTGTVVGGGTLAVNNRTTGNSFDISTNSGIPPNVWVWLKSPTVVAGKKPEYISVTLIGYRRYVAP